MPTIEKKTFALHREADGPKAADINSAKTMDAGIAKPASLRSRFGTLMWLVIALAAFYGGWKLATENAARPELVQLSPATARSAADTMLVTAAPISFRSVTRAIETVGTLHAYEEVTLSAKVDGRVNKIHHDLSSRVNPGDLLIEIDTTDAKLAVAQAERSVQAELAKWGFASVPTEDEDLSMLPTVVSARLKYELSRTQLQRMQALQATKSISLEEFEKAKSDTLVLESDWKNQLLLANSAAATARLKNADLAIMQQRLRDTQIRAPDPTMSASDADRFYRVSERMVSEGTMVRVGTEVMKMVLGHTLKLRLAVPEVYGADVVSGQKVEVVTSASQLPSYGTVARISPAVDRTTRAFLVEVDLPNEKGALRPGGFAKAKIFIATNERATTIPLAGLYSFAGIDKLFFVDQGVAREVKVTLGEQSENWIEITSPQLPADALVITSGQRLLSDGKAVAIRETSPSELGGSATPINEPITTRSPVGQNQ